MFWSSIWLLDETENTFTNAVQVAGAEKLYQQLPNAEWVEYSDRYSQEEIDRAREEGPATQQVALSLPFIEEFLQRIESDYT